MKSLWMIAILTVQISITEVFSNENPNDEENENPAQLAAEFIKEIVNQLRNNPQLENNVKEILENLKEAFSGKEYEGTFVPAVVKMLDEFLKNNYFISPETLLKIMKSVVNEATKEPDTVTNNLKRVWHRSVKTVGDTIRNVGGVGTAIVRVVKDLYNKHRAVTNPVFSEIPYIGPVLKKVNNAVANTLGAIQMIIKVAVKGTGTAITDYAERKRRQAKEKRAKENAKNKDKQEEPEETQEPEEKDDEQEPEKPKKPDESQPKKPKPPKKPDGKTPQPKDDKKPPQT